jgi:hypothetical protein
MARRRKNGRFTKSTRRRRSKPKTNLTNLAVSAAVANSITQGMFNTNLIEFATGRVDGKYKPGADGSSVLTLPELLGAGAGGIGGNYGSQTGYNSLGAVLKTNLEKNWMNIAIGVVLIPVIAKTATKLIRKPVILPANRMLKSVGLDVKL